MDNHTELFYMGLVSVFVPDEQVEALLSGNSCRVMIHAKTMEDYDVVSVIYNLTDVHPEAFYTKTRSNTYETFKTITRCIFHCGEHSYGNNHLSALVSRNFAARHSANSATE